MAEWWITENFGAMSKWRALIGMRVANKPVVSGYVLCIKLKKALENEFNAQRFSEYVATKNYSPNTSVSRLSKIDKLKSRLDVINSDSLSLIYNAYDNSDVMTLVKILDIPMAILQQAEKLEQKILEMNLVKLILRDET